MEERLKKDMAEMTFDLDRFFQPGYVIELCENVTIQRIATSFTKEDITIFRISLIRQKH